MRKSQFHLSEDSRNSFNRWSGPVFPFALGQIRFPEVLCPANVLCLRQCYALWEKSVVIYSRSGEHNRVLALEWSIG